MTNKLPTAIIGGGPVALAAAAQLVKRNMAFVLFEQGDRIGSSVHSWKHVRMFSPWEFNIDSAARELLLQAGWVAPEQSHLPTGEELLQHYMEPLANLDQLQPHIHLNAKVKAVYRKGFDKMKTAGRELAPFIIEYQSDNHMKRFEASAVIDATGTWLTPNPISSNGNDAEGEREHENQIFYGIPDVLGPSRLRYAGKNIAVVGSGHSAIQVISMLHDLKLQVPDTTIHWVLRKQDVSDAFGGGENDGLPARGELGNRAFQYVQLGNVQVHTPFLIDRIKDDVNGSLLLQGTKREHAFSIGQIDEIIVATGSRPAFSFLRELRYEIDSAIESAPQLAQLIDPNIHSCGTVRPHGEAELRQPEKNFYIVGSKSYGRAPTFLLATGYEQVRSVVAVLAGDYQAAREVKLQLPETGVCSTAKPASTSREDSCCSPQKITFKPLPVKTTECCSSVKTELPCCETTSTNK
ncbi:FAD-dependent pyridine nucleotide-disulfide oxidoreductase [Paenibacillus curdlanolyticus YK9]|uniref:FAD-dependent pyridine nucleotide-disulfide oxidoreductase n=1 Tax=Paenibacillus curdlanolyticus YK9 TaxID=717606 RepID=E0I5S1_9BACL|nr:NAD(P)-binding domain-containing protein [Paenibacillus curdlanolyticus]EFM12313.1 FAD-dependent pyridine nucleotide-disulfide oxidoreductase [Paenibacillus curdlanolyticus YK9]